MKRNVKSVFKFLALAGATAVVTVLLFRLIHNPDITRHSSLIQRENGPLPIAPEVSLFNSKLPYLIYLYSSNL